MVDLDSERFVPGLIQFGTKLLEYKQNTFIYFCIEVNKMQFFRIEVDRIHVLV